MHSGVGVLEDRQVDLQDLVDLVDQAAHVELLGVLPDVLRDVLQDVLQDEPQDVLLEDLAAQIHAQMSLPLFVEPSIAVEGLSIVISAISVDSLPTCAESGRFGHRLMVTAPRSPVTGTVAKLRRHT
ncbi:uncharacterized protein LOC117781338 [Drosophila innubila]|uniref:uncharacterized protein LOC117781338 n=1 Tax=Drosophila innubila TaxID=198719 RepID=UPI00148CE3F1|nr:uncharacterized protein LOC117781338 [Drosophila innubila]